MPRKIPIFYSALLLTGVNLLLRFIGTSFQVYLSGRIGAEGIGLLQLTMSVGSMAMIAGMGGIRTTAMYLTAEELGRGRGRNMTRILSGCVGYSLFLSSTVGFFLYHFAPWIAKVWIGNPLTADALRLFASFLPVVCLCGVMTGYFTAAQRIGTLAAVEVAEQICSMGLTILLLNLWAGLDPVKSCLSVIFGSSFGGVLTLSALLILRLKEPFKKSDPIPVRSRLLHIALPLALADDLKAGINTVENLMVPKRLALNRATENPLAAFGMVSGMVFPVIMFPAAILFGLTELLIPEMARCNSAGHQARIQYLTQKSLKVAFIYGISFGGSLFLLANPLCLRLYGNDEAAKYLKWYALLVPMLYCDAITDAITKGLGQQHICVRYNIITSFLDVVFLYLLLPRFGMEGYYFSFLLTHLVNFILSLRLLLRTTKLYLPLHGPMLSLAAMGISVSTSILVQSAPLTVLSYLTILGCLLFLFQVLHWEDLLWLQGLIRGKNRVSSAP